MSVGENGLNVSLPTNLRVAPRRTNDFSTRALSVDTRCDKIRSARGVGV